MGVLIKGEAAADSIGDDFSGPVIDAGNYGSVGALQDRVQEERSRELAKEIANPAHFRAAAGMAPEGAGLTDTERTALSIAEERQDDEQKEATSGSVIEGPGGQPFGTQGQREASGLTDTDRSDADVGGGTGGRTTPDADDPRLAGNEREESGTPSWVGEDVVDAATDAASAAAETVGVDTPTWLGNDVDTGEDGEESTQDSSTGTQPSDTGDTSSNSSETNETMSTDNEDVDPFLLNQTTAAASLADRGIIDIERSDDGDVLDWQVDVTPDDNGSTDSGGLTGDSQQSSTDQTTTSSGDQSSTSSGGMAALSDLQETLQSLPAAIAAAGTQGDQSGQQTQQGVVFGLGTRELAGMALIGGAIYYASRGS